MEAIAIAAMIISLLIAFIEFIYLYVLAETQEELISKYDKAYNKIIQMFTAILNAPTRTSLQLEVEVLDDYTKNEFDKKDIASKKLLEYMTDDTLNKKQQYAVKLVYEKLDPVSFYNNLLETGNVYMKAYSCRKLADFYSQDSKERIRKCAKSKNKHLSYNAGMALSVLGDEEIVVKFILECQNNREFSHRIILEMLENYTGDIVPLVAKILNKCDDYIRATVIKGVAGYRLVEFEDMYLKGLSSNDINVRTACVKALGKIAKPEYERSLIIALHDKDWVVRNSAIDGLEKINTINCIEAVYGATQDREWWVRFNAARALVKMDKDFTYVEAVLNGYDKYAADAVRSSMYRLYFDDINKREVS